MQFTRRLRARVVAGEIDCSVRIWRAARVKVGGRYSVEGGEIEVTALREISLSDVTPALARRSGFEGVVDLLRTARHGIGRRVFLVEFVFRATARLGPAGSA